jgi:hypothetical protein
LYLRSRTTDQKNLALGNWLCRRFPSDAEAFFIPIFNPKLFTDEIEIHFPDVFQ